MDYSSTTIITLGTSFITGSVALLSVYLTNRANTKRLALQLEHESGIKNKSFTRITIEELYELTDKWLKNLFITNFNLTLVMQEKLDYKQYIDITIKNAKTDDINFSRLEMLLYIYFNELTPFYNKVIDKRTELNEISTIYVHAYDRGDTNGKHYIKSFVKTQEELESLGELFKKEIANKARSI
ncbi:MAG: hypothetical protein MJK08_03935 [Campylobacterales bacterium]|nr:hypothetical protein [Campylobacterales bacterium]